MIITYEKELHMALYLDYEKKKKRNWFILGALTGGIITSGMFYINQIIQPIPKDTICKKGILFEQITLKGSVYLKTKKECVDIFKIK
tara:strand:- start:273 stop:533 length:261 start_codon:yes stop_codon:yes gene_type:complete